ncbi:MAG TPA: Rieske 2Fe-2S domain-containing protein, partial [Planctomycetota bacterium]|nr:Rieske 2Fe-2S domain-containing protein [Planctomycetota bacterium]
MATTQASQRAIGVQNPTRAEGVTRRGFLGSLGVGWAIFAMGAGAGTLGIVRFLFPNVLFEPPTTFKAGQPNDFSIGVDERFKETNGTWLVRTDSDPLSARPGVPGMYALSTTCTHLGCIPNWLAADQKFKCPYHDNNFHINDINFENPTPRPLERWHITHAEDGQVLIDKSAKFQWEKGQWIAPEA